VAVSSLLAIVIFSASLGGSIHIFADY